MSRYYDKTASGQPRFNKVDTRSQLATEMPPLPTKRQVCDHFGYTNTTYFFRKRFFQLVVPDSRYIYEDIKFNERLPAGLAQELYESLGWKEKRD